MSDQKLPMRTGVGIIVLNNKNQICYEGETCFCVHQYDRLDDDIKK